MLCKECIEWLNTYKDIDPARHCHHEEKPKEKCFCEYNQRNHYVYANNIDKDWEILFCPVCGRKL
jgi:hypothetical protein